MPSRVSAVRLGEGAFYEVMGMSEVHLLMAEVFLLGL